MRFANLAALAFALSALLGTVAKAAGVEFHAEDVDRFYELYEATDGHPTAEQLQRYLDEGSPDLLRFAKMRNITGERIAEAMEKNPATYADARRCLATLPNVRRRVGAALQELARLYPQMKQVPVTIVVGRARPVGVTSSTDKIIVIGLEALCATDWFEPNLEDRFVYVISHEYIHLQQPPSFDDNDHPTVLGASIMEGAAEFLGEKISGGIAYARFKNWTKGREADIETAFAADEDSKDLSKWLYNGKGTEEWLGDLGYWVGYRIVKSYYSHAADKHKAIQDILALSSDEDAKGFLVKSGWHPGAGVN